MYVGDKKKVLTEEEFNKELAKMQKEKTKPMVITRNNPEMPIRVAVNPTPVQQEVRLYSQTNTWLEPKDFKYSPKAIAERMGVDIESEEGKEIVKRFSKLKKEELEALGNGSEIKELLQTYELKANFDNIANLMEMLYGNSIRTKEEFEAAAPQRERILLQLKSIEIVTGLFETLAQWNDDYTDSIGLFGLGAEACGYLLNKIGLDGENHYQWADSCREFAQNAANLNPLNPEAFNEGFKNIYGDRSDKWGIEFNEEAFRSLINIIESGRATKNNEMTDEYKNAVLKAVNLVMDNPNESLYNQIMNMFGEALLMYMTMGIATEAKGAQIAASATTTAFSRAGVGIATKGLKSKLFQGALRYSGNLVKLMGPAATEGTKMMLYTLTEGTLTNAGNRIIKYDSEENSFEKFLATEQMVLDSSEGSFGFGAFAGVFGTVVTSKVLQSASRVSEKVGAALAEKFAQGSVSANEVFATFIEKSAPTKLAEVAAYATDVLGFTAFETVTTALSNMEGFPDNVTTENVVNFLWAELKNQGYSLGQLKVISHLVMFMTGSKNARVQSQKYIREQIPQLEGVKVSQNGEGFTIHLASGKKVECKNINEMLTACQLMVTGETALSKTFAEKKGQKTTVLEEKNATTSANTFTPASHTETSEPVQETKSNTPTTEAKEVKKPEKAPRSPIPAEGYIDCKGEFSPEFRGTLEQMRTGNGRTVFDANVLEYLKTKFTTEELKQVEEIYKKANAFAEGEPISQNEIPRLMKAILMGKYFQETKDFDFASKILDFASTQKDSMLYCSSRAIEFFDRVNRITLLTDAQAIKGLIDLSKTCENPLIKNLNDINTIVQDMTLEGFTPVEIVDAMRRTDQQGQFLLGTTDVYNQAKIKDGFKTIKDVQSKNHKFQKEIKLPKIERSETFDLETYKANNPQLKAQIEKLEQEASPNEIEILARLAENNPEYKDDIFNIVSQNKNIKFGIDTSGQINTEIYDFVNILKENTNLHDEIVEFMSVKHIDDGSTQTALTKLKKYIQLLNEEPENATLIRRFGQNPNLEPEEISDLILFGQNRLKNDPQGIEDMLFFSSKKLDSSAIRKNVVLLKRSPELRNTLTSETPTYQLIDQEPAKTPQDIIKKRFSVRDNVEKVAPEGLKELEKTLGKDYYNKVRWEEIIPENATPTQIRQIISELNAKCKFFARIERNEKAYGKNIQWASEIYNIEQVATYNMKYGDEMTSDFFGITDLIAERYRDLDVATTLEGNRDRRINSGIPRLSRDGWEKAQTGYTEKDYGAYGYSQRFYKNNRQSPYSDVELTRTHDTGLYNDGNYTGRGQMLHPDRASINPAMAHANDRFEEIRPLIEKVKNGGILTDKEKDFADKNIAEIYFLLANTMPWNRGSNGICDIFMRSIYDCIGIDKPAIKRNVSLDLEAFCMSLEEYQQKWNSFFED